MSTRPITFPVRTYRPSQHDFPDLNAIRIAKDALDCRVAFNTKKKLREPGMARTELLVDWMMQECGDGFFGVEHVIDEVDRELLESLKIVISCVEWVIGCDDVLSKEPSWKLARLRFEALLFALTLRGPLGEEWFRYRVRLQ